MGGGGQGEGMRETLMNMGTGKECQRKCQVYGLHVPVGVSGRDAGRFHPLLESVDLKEIWESSDEGIYSPDACGPGFIDPLN